MAQQPVAVLDIVNCVRPVYFLNEDREWPLSASGTAFVVRYQGRHFVLTARHVLNLRHFAATQFRVQYQPEANQFIPLESCHLLPQADAEDPDQSDLAVWSVHEKALQAELFGQYTPYPLLSIDALTLFNPQADYLYRGFPTRERDFDPDARHMRQTAVSGRAQYVGPTRYAGVHELKLLALGDLASLDGFSGAPVFQVNPLEGRYSAQAFAGILIRGTRGSERAYFLEHRRVLEMLAQVCCGDVRDVGP